MHAFLYSFFYLSHTNIQMYINEIKSSVFIWKFFFVFFLFLQSHQNPTFYVCLPTEYIKSLVLLISYFSLYSYNHVHILHIYTYFYVYANTCLYIHPHIFFFNFTKKGILLYTFFGIFSHPDYLMKISLKTLKSSRLALTYSLKWLYNILIDIVLITIDSFISLWIGDDFVYNSCLLQKCCSKYHSPLILE